MHYAAIKKYDIANGPGCRVSLFVSGCRRHCNGCFNAEAQAFDYGTEYTAETRRELLEMLSDEHIAGLSILGGDPFEPENQQTVYELCKIAKACYRQKDIWAWTGFMWEDIQNSHILDYVDVLVDGPFILKQKDLGLAYRGSRNQRVIDVKKSRVENGVVQLEGDWR